MKLVDLKQRTIILLDPNVSSYRILNIMHILKYSTTISHHNFNYAKLKIIGIQNNFSGKYVYVSISIIMYMTCN